MDRIFIDTNVAIDYLAARQPFDKEANEIFKRAAHGQLEICICALSLVTIAYVYRKIQPGANIKQVLTNLQALSIITPVDNLTISAALQSNFKNFEDAVQHYSAYHFSGVTHLITRNIKDFANSLLPVLSPSEYLVLHP